MKFLGIDFLPLNTPFEHIVQRLAAALIIQMIGSLGIITILFNVFLLFTRFWCLPLFYMCWLYFDRNAGENGGRVNLWILNWKIWEYGEAYFKPKLEFAPNCTLDAKRNYLFACFPHGILPHGTFMTIRSVTSPFHRLYPAFDVKVAVLPLLLWIPGTREIALGIKYISCSAKSLSYVLKSPEGGKIVLLYPGGAREAYNSKPGLNKFTILRRKGFVKVALKNGVPLVPVVTFRECDLFEQIEGPCIRRFQEFVRGKFGFVPILVNGWGLFQNTFGVVPRQVPLATVVGTPIEVERVENPSQEQIDALHNKFKLELKNLFEEYKFKFLDNPEQTFLEFE
ncbi:2-acylglycerol O-acyltransferase 1 isoform X1 [Tribolium castaneum]|uniref:Acyltransferase n=1 Tax=Tribolium castaneum TaxID=7070 RepID=D6W8X4_TRICA|nr:PREDICTED: 2-acylglycerol O-acyltransferase 1 [Tribolium castaneum]EEZ98241.2 2-acylglycerol O-acyltransferase 1-like Protein [Tribolium castaneum]|eukprot:XP_008201425.1 PREDICTED: 2-acylglycerol O-acyltransferase 1 [Tribolium castaneum]